LLVDYHMENLFTQFLVCTDIKKLNVVICWHLNSVSLTMMFSLLKRWEPYMQMLSAKSVNKNIIKIWSFESEHDIGI
jgi:hypothetical protein